MENALVIKHNRYLQSFIEALHRGEFDGDADLCVARALSSQSSHAITDTKQSISKELLLDKVKSALQRVQDIDQYHIQLNKGQRKSYFNAIRTWLEHEHNFLYTESLMVISKIFEPLYSSSNPGYRRYAEAVQTYRSNNRIDEIDAQSEWRGYFEYRFLYPISSFIDKRLPSHWITLNLAPYSFLAEQLLPVYRMPVNVPGTYKEVGSPYALREKSFELLGKIRSKAFSFVYELVKNNIKTVFYFDKVPNVPNFMAAYEIDPDIGQGQSRGKPRWAGKCTFDARFRSGEPLVNDSDEVESILSSYESLRKNNENEKKFQFRIIRFLIRSGVFDPRWAAYIKGSDPDFRNLIYERTSKKITDSEQRHINLDDLNKIVERQYNSSIKRKAFDHDDKYSGLENDELDLVIHEIDENHSNFINARIATFEAGFFTVTQKDSTIDHIYWFPIPLNWRKQEVGGAVYLNSDERIEDEYTNQKHKGEYAEIQGSDNVPQRIMAIIYFFQGIFADKQIGEIEEKVRPNAERAAAISIMSRNISHNIGSHVLSYLKNLLSDEMQMLQQKVFENLIIQPKGSDFWTINPYVIGRKSGNDWIKDELASAEMRINTDRLATPYLRSLGRLFGYFQERQDYIGTLASDWYLYYGPVNFKNDVVGYFSELLGAKALDNLTETQTRNLILDFISHSEEYVLGDIKIDVKWREANVISETIPENLEVALPSGNTGRQGLYTILENFIRNTAKHGASKAERGGKLIITMTLSDEDENYYRLELLDNGQNTTDAVVSRIREALNTDLVDSSGSPNEQHKGIKEIQIASGWLRGIRPYQLREFGLFESDFISDETSLPDINKHLPVVKVDRVNNNLQYTLYLRKTKPALLIVEDAYIYFEDSEEKRLKKEYEHLADWDILTFKSNIEINPDKIPYRFVFVHQSISIESNIKSIRSQYPVRLLTGVSDAQLLKKETFQELYIQWIEGSIDVDGIHLKRFGLVFDKPASEFTKKPIGIDDDIKFKNDYPVHEDLKKWVINDSASAVEQSILFRIHNDSPRQFNDFAYNPKNNFEKYVFVEGISGSNSTDRIIRRQEKNEFWRLKLIEAALTKIIIVDERIWRALRKNTDEEGFFHYRRLNKKNIHILTLETREGRLEFIDLCNHTVAYLNRKGEIEYADQESKRLYYYSHFITVHQGLLDRAMKHCNEIQCGPLDYRLMATLLVKSARQNLWATLRFVIHSGRSKTAALPKHSAFIQLSSLDTALNDCKLNLCELFYSTIEEE